MLDADLTSFIRSSIRSTWSLELLLQLRAYPAQAFERDELVRILRATPSLISNCLDQLEKSGLVVREEDGKWRYAPAAAALHELCANLAAAYAERPVTVINIIVGAPDDRLKTFADAFRFTKKEP